MGMKSVRIVHPAGNDLEVEIVRLTPRTVAIELEVDLRPKVFSRSNGTEWGIGQGWKIADEDLGRLANEPEHWKQPVQRKPLPESWFDARAPWQPPGGNVTDMPLAQLRHLGYVDEDTVERESDGNVTFDYSDEGWENFTKEDFDRLSHRRD